MSDFQRRNTEIVAVVVDPIERNAEVAEHLGLGYRIVADPELRVIDAYGLRHDREGDTAIARPATFLIDAEGVIRWRDLTENFRRRPSPDQVLARVDELS